jgi:taurine--2-oxoglutarate transaminase
MLFTGLTYCGHPLACAAGIAAVEAYGDERLIERSRALGALMFERLKSFQSRHSIIGDVRGGDGLFAVIELVRDRTTRESPATWPGSPDALKNLVRDALHRDVSFAIRGNLILLAPPLVIGETELGDALTLLEELLAAVHF